jgi:hypothetical protein
MTNISIIRKFIQSEIDTNRVSNEYILALNECTTLEDLIDEVSMWKNLKTLSASHYILTNLDT